MVWLNRWIDSAPCRRGAAFIAVMVNFYSEAQRDGKESGGGTGYFQIWKEASLRPSSAKMDFLLLVPLLLQSSGCYEKSNLISASFQRAVIQDIRQPCKCKKMFFWGGNGIVGRGMEKRLLFHHTINLRVHSFAVIALHKSPSGRKEKALSIIVLFWFFIFLVALCLVCCYTTALLNACFWLVRTCWFGTSVSKSIVTTYTPHMRHINRLNMCVNR